MTCSTSNLPSGINRNCKTALREVSAVLIFKPGNSTFANAGALNNIENLRVKMQEEETLYVLDVQSSTATKGEPNVVTTGYGVDMYVGENAPKLTVYAKTNACDFVEMLKAYEGGGFECMFLGADGKMLKVTDGSSLYGFYTYIHAVSFGVPDRDTQAEQFQVEFSFVDDSEFRNYDVSDVNYTPKALQMLYPVGLTMRQAVAFNTVADTVTVDVNNRCSTTEYTDVLTGRATDTNVVGAVVTVVPTYNATNLNYDVLIQKGGAALATGEFVEYQLLDKDGNVINRITNKLKVTA